MKISIIIPIYKVEKYLRQCVDSVLSQSYKDIEVILVDDGSPDCSPQICDEYAEKDSRVKVIHKENGGVADARNYGLLNAKGDYVVFLDSDDFYTDDKAIENWVKRLAKTSADILIFGYKKYYQKNDTYSHTTEPLIDENEIYVGKSILDLMKQGIYIISPWDKVVSRSFLLNNEIDFVLNQHSEDMEWCIKILNADPRICVDKRVYYAYRKQVLVSRSSVVTKKAINDIATIIKKYAKKEKELTNEQLLINNFVANIYVQWLNLSHVVKEKEIKDLLSEMSDYMYLLSHNVYPYVQIASKFKFVGFHILRRMIYFYYRFKNRKL